MSWLEIVREFLEKAPKEEYSAPEIVDTMFPELSSYRRTFVINKVTQALNQGCRWGYFEKLGIKDHRRYWRLAI